MSDVTENSKRLLELVSLDGNGVASVDAKDLKKTMPKGVTPESLDQHIAYLDNIQQSAEHALATAVANSDHNEGTLTVSLTGNSSIEVLANQTERSVSSSFNMTYEGGAENRMKILETVFAEETAEA